ncbi:MAG: adenylate/guanylate cyclase domain-containing protein, partial [Aggregatilineales bacterium]
ILAVPLKVRDKVIGVVYTDNRFMSGLFKQAELEILTAFAAQAAVAIENAQLFENSRLSLQQVTEVRDLMDNIFTSITSAIIVLSHQDNIVVSNAAAETILDSNAIIGKSWHDVFPELSEDFAAALDKARVGEQTSLVEQPTLHGSERYWTVIVSPLQGDNNGMGGGVTIVLDDVTEQQQQDAQVAEVRRYLPLALIESVKSVDDINLGGQEREITALFADIRGFTTFSERLEPEELMRVINQYLSLASDSINLYEGIVDKYMGDAVTGLWNTQLNPQPDHATRAVQTALQLVLDLRAHHEMVTEENRLFYGIGIHTGPAVLGNVGGKGRKEFAALGEATNICKYLQEQAGEAEIIISEATYEIVKDDFECERRTEIVREKAGYEHIAFYAVLQRKTRGLSPFVDEELLALLGDELDS